MTHKYKVTSLFCGCGGSDLGLVGGFNYLNKRYKKLPFNISLALDVNQKAINTYNENFKHLGTCQDVREVNLKELKEVDILIGGFPCQSFSTVNPTKDPEDERANLYKHMARFLKVQKPKVFIAENVKGMLYLKKGEIYKNIEREFSKAGYRVTHKLINSADFGVPQKRERVFMVGVRKDIKADFEFPKQTNYKEPTGREKGWAPLGDVIDSLVPEDPKYYFSERAVLGMKRAKKNMKRGLWQNLEEPCLTVTAHLAKVSLNSRDPVLLVDPKKELYRRFTPREAARIQSFPDSFTFVGSEADTYRQVGEAIAPVVMWHIAKSVSDFLDSNLD